MVAGLAPRRRVPLARHARYRREVLADSPVGYWRLAEAPGATTAADASGNGRDGTYNGTVTLGQAGALYGGADMAALFDGSTGYVSVPDTEALDYPGSGGWTVEAWVKLNTSLGVAREACSKLSSAGQYSWDLWVDGNGNAQWRLSSDGTALSSITGATVLGTGWTHIAGVYTGTQLLIYVNGVSDKAPVAYSSGIFASTTAVAIGRNESPGAYMSGAIDDVAIYNTALPAERVLAHYRAGVLGS